MIHFGKSWAVECGIYTIKQHAVGQASLLFPKSFGKPRVDDKGVLRGIIFINRNGLRWCDAPEKYGPHKTLYSRWKRWRVKGIFAKILLSLADQSSGTDTLMIDAIHLGHIARPLVWG